MYIKTISMTYSRTAEVLLDFILNVCPVESLSFYKKAPRKELVIFFPIKYIFYPLAICTCKLLSNLGITTWSRDGR